MLALAAENNNITPTKLIVKLTFSGLHGRRVGKGDGGGAERNVFDTLVSPLPTIIYSQLLQYYYDSHYYNSVLLIFGS